jgi:tetraacyldisaccharide 4'-kinase
MSWLLRGLEPVYGLAVGAKNTAYDRGWLRMRRLQGPVVSVGNLSVGGAGKTPVVIALARLLAAQGVAVDVLSRGYGRRSSIAVERVDPKGDARRYGDEPVLIARAAQVPVYVGASRWAAGRLAEQAGGRVRVHLLDDGMQHRQLARDVEIVVLHPQDLRDLRGEVGGSWGARLLPVGRLREPVQSLDRADVLVLRDDDGESEALLAQLGIGKPVLRVRRRLQVPQVAGAAAAFCGIAHPGEFFNGLEAQGVRLGKRFAFADHHAYTEKDLRGILRDVTMRPHLDLPQGPLDGLPVQALLTTEKDMVRLRPAMRALLEAERLLLAVPLVAEFVEPQRCAAMLREALKRRVAT